jgi:hypothetical protein
MAQKIINAGSGELTGDGESIRAAFVKTNDNFSEVYNAIGNIHDLGNLRVTGTNLQSISGTIPNEDINLVPNGTGSVSVPRLKIPVGTIVGSSVPIVAAITDLTLDSVIDWSTSTSDALVQGEYGVTNGIPAPWAVYRFTTNPSPVVQVDDVLGGAGIPALPNPSVILAVGTGTWSNIVIAYSNFSTFAPPVAGITVTVARATTHASMNIETNALTDVNLNVGVGGKIITHGSVLPYDTNLVDLGSPAKRFRKLWLGGGTIYVLDETLGTDQAIGARDGNLYIVGGAGLKVGEFTLRDNTIAIANNARDIIIGTTTATGEVIFNRPIQINTTASIQAFAVNRNGRVVIRTPNIPLQDQGALNIVGSSDGSYQVVSGAGNMLHITGNDNLAGKITLDGFGTSYQTGSASITGRGARGTAASPTNTQAGDVLFRLSAIGYSMDNYLTANTGGSPLSIEFVAKENYTSSTIGSAIKFYTSPVGQAQRTLSAQIDTNGLSFVGNSTGGITFQDATRQTTAWTGTVSVSNIAGSLVNKVIVGNGLSAANQTGIVTIDATGVQTVVGTANRIIVTDSGSKNLTLSTPQDLATTSSVTFQNITVTGNINVLGTSTVSQNSVVQGKIIYLANTASSSAQIDGGGIQLGTGTFTKSILYSNSNNWWDTGSAGLKTSALSATTATVNHIDVSGVAHLGTAYEDNLYANAALTVNANINSYSQIVSVNHNTGTSASSDLVLVNNIGNDGANYIDMGINSSVYSNSDYSITQANDGYLFVNGGNLAIGTQSSGTNIVFHTGGTTSDKLRVTISDTGLSIVGKLNGLTLPGVSTTAGYVLSNNGSGVTSWVQPQTGYVGSRGYTGSQGVIGFTGSRGTDGIIGYNGSFGFTGSQGITGANGFTGSTGNIGFTGSKGDTGFTGYTGFTGSASTASGYIGSTGYTGSQGDIGFIGSQGITGFVGSRGDTGFTGFTGFTGSTGTQGVIGFTGSTGTQGVIGFTGSQGVIGFTGSRGYNGSQGTIGYSGSQGPAGTSVRIVGSTSTSTSGAFSGVDPSPTLGDGIIVSATGHLWTYTGSGPVGGFTDVGVIVGPTGATGAIGYSGSQGITGYWGSTGAQGIVGFTGSQGTQGITGFVGSTGTQGVIGFTGSVGSGFVGSAGVGYVGSSGTLGYTGSAGSAPTPAITSVTIQGDGTFTATSTVTNVVFIPGGRMELNINTGTNQITITDNAKGSKKHRAKHKSGAYDPDIDMLQPEDTITYAEGGGILLSTNSSTNTLTIATEFTGTTVLAGTLTVNPASVSKNAVGTQTFTITGLTTSHHIVITPATALTYGIFISAAWVSASNTVSVQFMNITGGSIDLGNIDIDYFAWV